MAGFVLAAGALQPVGAQEAPAEEGAAADEESDENSKVGEEGEAAAQPSRKAPYDDRLLRLSEIVGSIHYLRQLCEAEDDPRWRGMMRDLIEAEAAEPDRRARFTAAFNRGYRAFASVYADCTPAAVTAEARYRREGATLASEIIARFGN